MACFVDLVQVVLGVGFDPFFVKHEVYAGEVCGAAGVDDTLREGVFHRGFFKDLLDQGFEVKRRDHNGGRSGVNDGIKCIVLFSCVFLESTPSIGVLNLSIANSDTLTVIAPKEVFWNHLNGFESGIFTHVVVIRGAKVDPRERAWLGEIERENVFSDVAILVQSFDVEGTRGVSSFR